MFKCELGWVMTEQEKEKAEEAIEYRDALRADTPQRLERLRGLLAPLQLCVVKFTDVLDQQSECAALRAEVDHWAAEASAFDGQRMAAESRLGAATELLVDALNHATNGWERRVRAFLATQPAAPEKPNV